ncbi:MAG: hypothetical protein AVDCRST_MAG59-4778 [uncultured Thermomicrobiales bacterium]|uniref:Uncharacterized protein n=1 Tax=uncultured Thermomicrobiales bacterium TaxID=1645740 RepID=A0A6J4VJ16_9BACT|nr:MAG: hypothetical protein AVDCRST_MAG59-4778 [uncultured Thermomicrobiales bacterium]
MASGDRRDRLPDILAERRGGQEQPPLPLEVGALDTVKGYFEGGRRLIRRRYNDLPHALQPHPPLVPRHSNPAEDHSFYDATSLMLRLVLSNAGS